MPPETKPAPPQNRPGNKVKARLKAVTDFETRMANEPHTDVIDRFAYQHNQNTAPNLTPPPVPVQPPIAAQPPQQIPAKQTPPKMNRPGRASPQAEAVDRAAEEMQNQPRTGAIDRGVASDQAAEAAAAKERDRQVRSQLQPRKIQAPKTPPTLARNADGTPLGPRKIQAPKTPGQNPPPPEPTAFGENAMREAGIDSAFNGGNTSYDRVAANAQTADETAMAGLASGGKQPVPTPKSAQAKAEEIAKQAVEEEPFNKPEPRKFGEPTMSGERMLNAGDTPGDGLTYEGLASYGNELDRDEIIRAGEADQAYDGKTGNVASGNARAAQRKKEIAAAAAKAAPKPTEDNGDSISYNEIAGKVREEPLDSQLRARRIQRVKNEFGNPVNYSSGLGGTAAPAEVAKSEATQNQEKAEGIAAQAAEQAGVTKPKANSVSSGYSDNTPDHLKRKHFLDSAARRFHKELADGRLTMAQISESYDQGVSQHGGRNFVESHKSGSPESMRTGHLAGATAANQILDHHRRMDEAQRTHNVTVAASQRHRAQQMGLPRGAIVAQDAITAAGNDHTKRQNALLAAHNAMPGRGFDQMAQTEAEQHAQQAIVQHQMETQRAIAAHQAQTQQQMIENAKPNAARDMGQAMNAPAGASRIAGVRQRIAQLNPQGSPQSVHLQMQDAFRPIVTQALQGNTAQSLQSLSQDQMAEIKSMSMDHNGKPMDYDSWRSMFGMPDSQDAQDKYTIITGQQPWTGMMNAGLGAVAGVGSMLWNNTFGRPKPPAPPPQQPAPTPAGA